ncbi:TniQ protein [Devosia crocina]|uniref:TniQ protein n=2 Tax=Devosia crocina TaxID=429728 RepID=A0A1I7NAN1_9HYPH|nr:TniQ protein [Devosia crocina]
MVRATASNGWPSQKAFRRRIGALKSERKLDPALMARAFGCDSSEFGHFADEWVFSHVVSFAGHHFRTDEIDGKRRRICPTCCAGLQSARFEWELPQITQCPDHGPLTGSCACGNPLTWSDRHMWVCNDCPAPIWELPPAPMAGPSDLPFERYFLGRLGRSVPVPCPILDALPLPMAADVAEAIGGVLEIGYALSLPDVIDDERARRRERGYRSLAAGDVGRAFSPAVDEFRARTGNISPKQPIASLGFIAGIPALHARGGEKLNDLLCAGLGRVLGYPVHDLWRTDYLDGEWCAGDLGISMAQLIAKLRDGGWMSKCPTDADRLFVPVDVVWLLRRAAG